MVFTPDTATFCLQEASNYVISIGMFVYGILFPYSSEVQLTDEGPGCKSEELDLKRMRSSEAYNTHALRAQKLLVQIFHVAFVEISCILEGPVGWSIEVHLQQRSASSFTDSYQPACRCLWDISLHLRSLVNLSRVDPLDYLSLINTASALLKLSSGFSLLPKLSHWITRFLEHISPKSGERMTSIWLSHSPWKTLADIDQNKSDRVNDGIVEARQRSESKEVTSSVSWSRCSITRKP